LTNKIGNCAAVVVGGEDRKMNDRKINEKEMWLGWPPAIFLSPIFLSYS
jgi:hypothetical protein